MLHLSLKFRVPKRLEARRHLGSGHKTVNGQWPRIFRVTGVNQNARKVLFTTDLVKLILKLKLIFSYDIGQYDNGQGRSISLHQKAFLVELLSRRERNRNGRSEGNRGEEGVGKGGNACPKIQ